MDTSSEIGPSSGKLSRESRLALEMLKAWIEPVSLRSYSRSVPLCWLALAGAALFGASCLGQAGPGTGPGAGVGAELTSVREIRGLSSAQAQQAHPIHLHGVVTVLSGWKSSFFFQDETSGISVDRENDTPAVHSGDEVDIRGVTGPGRFAPVVLAKTVTVLGKGKLPATRFFSPAELAGGKQDSQYIAVRGMVRSAGVQTLWGRQALVLNLDIGGGSRVDVRVHDFSPQGFGALIGASVIVQGVCGTVFNDKRQFVGVRLFAASLDDVKIEKPATGAPFELPVQPLDSLLQFDEHNGAISRVRVRGVVTYARAGEGLFLQNGAQGIFVQSDQATQVSAGAWVDAVGYPAVGRYSPKLEDAVFRIDAHVDEHAGGSGGEVKPAAHDAAEMIVTSEGFSSAPYDSMLVQVKGRLIEEVPNAHEYLLIFQDGATVFTARLPRLAKEKLRVTTGSLLRITGVCTAIADESHEARGFEILLRSAADIAVIENAPWWTANHAVWVVVVLVVTVLALIGWLAVMRRQASLRALAVADPLTGLYNRRGFLLLAEQQWQLAKRGRVPFLLFYIDVDQFKEINDNFGHKEGDAALQEVANVLRECFRKSDIVGRLGGDEFAVAAVDADPTSKTLLEGRLHSNVEQKNEKGGRVFRLSLSVGALMCDNSIQAKSIEELLARADELMYEQKKHRKHR